MPVCPVCEFDKPCLDATLKSDMTMMIGEQKKTFQKDTKICTACASTKEKMPAMK